ncbi:glucarate dehydratase [Escherichia coli]|nr:glucarate dehydratase [Escherichia coli]
MKVIPVAGHDSMLLNIGGAHNAYFTRNIVVLTDNAGHTGIGEAPGGEVIYQTLVEAIPMVLGQEVARLNKVVQQVHKGNQAAILIPSVKGPGPLNCALTPWRRWKPPCLTC